jgi:hypothetical protein
MWHPRCDDSGICPSFSLYLTAVLYRFFRLVPQDSTPKFLTPHFLSPTMVVKQKQKISPPPIFRVSNLGRAIKKEKATANLTMNTPSTPKQCRLRSYRHLCAGLASSVAILAFAVWSSASWAGTLACTRNGTVVPPQGTLKIGDKLICGNQGSGGGDVDIFTVRKASSCPLTISQVIALGTGQNDPAVEHQIQVTFMFTGSIPADPNSPNPNAKSLEEGTTNIVYLCAGTTANFSAIWDTDPPPPISLVRTTVDLADGVATIVGGVGSVEGGATVTVRNNLTGTSQAKTAASDGSTTLRIAALEDNKLAITVKDRHWNTSTIPNDQGNPVALETVVTALPYPAERGPCTTETRRLLINSSQPLALPLTSGPIFTWASMIYPLAGSCTKDLDLPVVLFVHGLLGTCIPPTSSCPPHHQGYEYVMETLAQHGFFAISVYDSGGPEMVLAYLDLLKKWHRDGTEVVYVTDDGPVKYSDYLDGSLAIKERLKVVNDRLEVGLVGHSHGGSVVSDALNLNWMTGQPHKIIALAGIAPPYAVEISKAPYLLLMGTADHDCMSGPCFSTYDSSFVNTGGSAGSPQYPKMAVVAYGADHRNFNTTWVGPAWGYLEDGDGVILNSLYPPFLSNTRLSGTNQRKLAQATLTAFFRWHMQGETGYRKMFTGEHRFYELSEMTGYNIFSTFQDSTRLTVDDFQQGTNGTNNSLGGGVDTTFTAFKICKPFFDNNLLNAIPDGDTCPLPMSDGSPGPNNFLHTATGGIQLHWQDISTMNQRVRYTTSFPVINVSDYAYLSFRAAKRVNAIPTDNVTDPNSQDINLYVRLVDSADHAVEVRSDQYGILKPPYSSAYSYLSGVRIPLDHFRLNGSTLDLAHIQKVEFLAEGTGIVAIDDIEFGN